MEKREPMDRLTEIGLLLIVFFIPLCEVMIYVGMLLALIGWVYKLRKGKSKSTPRTPLDFPIIIFVIIGFISTFNSSILKQSLIALPLVVAAILLSYYLILINITDKKFLEKFVLVMILGGTIAACFGISQHLIQGIEPSGTTLGNPNILGSYLILIIPIVFSLLFYAPKRGKKILLTFPLITMVICLIFTRSRASWLALVGAMSFLLIIEKKRRVAIGLALVIIIAISLLIPSVKARLGTIFDLDFSTDKERIYGAKSALQMIKDHPLTGMGINTFYHIYPQYQLPEARVHLAHAHNIFLQIGVEMGLFGLITFLWLLIKVFKVGWKTLKKIKDDYLRALVIGVLTSLVAFLINQEFDCTWGRANLFIFFWVLLVILVTTRNLTLEKNRNYD